MPRFLAFTTLLAATLALIASTASATPPTKETFEFGFEYEETFLCPGLTILWSHQERQTVIDFSPTKVRIQRHGVATLSANGKSVTHNFNATIMLDPSTTVVKVVGTVYNIQVPGGGNVLLDAGNIVLDVSTDPPTLLHVAGPHQQFSGDVAGLCDYLAAP